MHSIIEIFYIDILMINYYGYLNKLFRKKELTFSISLLTSYLKLTLEFFPIFFKLFTFNT